MNVKFFVVLLVVLALLLIFGLAAPALSGSQPFDPNGGLASSLRGMLEHSLDPADVQASPAGCLQGKALVVPAGQACTYTIAKAGGLFAGVRRMDLQLEQGGGLQIVLDQQDSLTGKYSLKAGGEAETIRIFDQGGSMAAVCAGLEPCRVVWK